MGFVKEELTQAQGEDLQKKYNLKWPRSSYAVAPRHRVIDNDHNAFLVGIMGSRESATINGKGGAGESNYSLLVWNDKKVLIAHHDDFTTESAEAFNRGEATRAVIVTQITAPTELEDKKDQLIEMIQTSISLDEALPNAAPDKYPNCSIEEDAVNFVSSTESYL